MKNIFIISIAILSFTFIACEKVIDLEINDADTRFVIEAFTSNIDGRNFVKISKTGNVYTTNTFEKVSNASVVITDKNNQSFTFLESATEKGKYVLPGFAITENTEYTLKIIAEGKTITGTSKSRTIAPLNWLAPIKGSAAFGSDTSKLTVAFSFTDPIPKGDNYRFIVTIDGVQDDYYYIGSDFLINEPENINVLFATSIDSGATVHIELLNMDEANYNYLFGLVNNTETGPFSATPANPVSNLDGDVLGVFGAFMMDTATIVMPQ